MIPTSQKISRVYNTHVMPTRTKWRTPHTINYCPYSLQLTRWTLFYLLGRACPKHPRYGPSNELCLLVHSLNLFCVLFMLAIVCTYMLMPTGSLQLLLLTLGVRMRSESYSSRSVCVSVCVSVRTKSRTTGYEAAHERYQQLQCYKGRKNNVAILLKRLRSRDMA